MAENSAIEWTHHTFNPWWGCVKVSEACRNCYAATFAKRFGVEWGPQARRRFASEKVWSEPVKWNRAAERAGERHRIFCASMADVFEALPASHPDAEAMDAARDRLFDLIADTPHLDWLLLTKRPEAVRYLVPPSWWGQRFPRNVWVGTTVENQREADRRLPELERVPAAVRFLSCEPLLDRVDLTRYLGGGYVSIPAGGGQLRPANVTHKHFHWVICGGESGPGARPMHPVWARSLRDQCKDAGVPFFFKQWGEWMPRNQLPAGWSMAMGQSGPALPTHVWSQQPDDYAVRLGKKVAGRHLDGRTWDHFPEVVA